MTSRKLIGTAALGMLVLILGNIVSATDASNSMPLSSIGKDQRMVTANDLKPPECASLDLAKKLSGSGTFGNGSDSAPILGSPGADDIKGGASDDCIVDGVGDHTLVGGAGNGTYDASCEIR